MNACRLLLRTLLLSVALCPALMAAPVAGADEFPTSGRVEYVLECMQKHDGKYEYLYKCSCAIDHIAGQMRYDDYVAMSTALRGQTMGGERGAEFRDPPAVKALARTYQGVQTAANKACFVS
jgi:hypothetical protein